ncbi:MAG: phage tail sheath C-terminal domain-containing protein [Bacteroidota bacterium]
MPTYKTPGVYVEEITKLPPSIAEVETAIPAFIGYTENARLKEDGDLLNQPTKINSIFDYERLFGKAQAEGDGAITITIEENRDGSTTVQGKVDESKRSPYLMYYSMQAFFANGGGPCYIVSVGDYSTGIVARPNLEAGLAEVAKEDEVTLILFPDGTNMTPTTDYYSLQKSALDQCVSLQDRFVIMDVYAHNDIAINDVEVFRASDFGNKDVAKYGATYYPYLETGWDYQFEADKVDILHVGGDGSLAGKLDALESKNNRFYNQALNAINAISMVLPPSSSIAGIYAQVDAARGVWKAPANVGVDNAIRPVVKITDLDQEDLNVDVTAGKSVNAIRSFTGRGPAIVWGARTLAGNDLEWRYISVRRFFNMVEESVKKATVQFVFEPNDVNTWTRVKSMIGNFLNLQWRNGALQGTTPEEAYFVKIGLNETMNQQDILEGRMIVEIGMAVVRPAEFIILRFSHKLLDES